METMTYTNPCPGISNGLPGLLLTQLLQTLLSSHCMFGNPKHYPDDCGDELIAEQEFDFIIVGGGSAGSVIANRLSEVENWRILLLEAGDTPTFQSDIPGFTFSSHRGELDWNYKSEADGKTCLSMENQRCNIAKGKGLGGSSIINLMHYTRGNADDYNGWERLGNPGWNFEDVLPYFRKSEKLHKDFTLMNDTDYDSMIRAVRKTVKGNEKSTYEFSKLVHEDFHSVRGELPVNHFSYDFYLSILKKTYCYAVDEIGLDCISDVNGENQLGFVHALGTLDRGTRANTAKVFLNPVKSRSNLFVAKKSHVGKLIMRGNRTVGVELVRDDKKMKVFAKKEVILSAGVINSPKILMLSGIGPKKHLETLDIPVVNDLPGVGQNLQSHVTFFGLPVSIDKSVPEPLKLLQKFDGVYEFLTRGSGLYGNIAMNDVIGFVATEEKSTLPDVQLLHFLNHMNDTYFFNELFTALGATHEITNELADFTSESKVMLVCPMVLKPKSRGTVELRSKKESDPPKIRTNILQEEEDMQTLLRGIRLAMKLMNTTSFETMEAEPLKLVISGCENLKFDTKDYWKCLAGHLASPLHDYAGTCKMGPKSDEIAVVDNTLKVHGVKGLRVADSSIMPEIIRGSTHITAIMIGEKVSDLIKGEWGKGSGHDEL